jgi:hypothetical protein
MTVDDVDGVVVALPGSSGETGGDRTLEVTPGNRPIPSSPEVAADPFKP